jgi:UDP-glucose 4-epimerase
MSALFSQIIILGHTGFIGNALFEYFTRLGDFPVVGLASSTLDLTQAVAQETLGALLDRQTLLVFTAARTLDRGMDCLATFDTNIAMALNVARALSRHPVRKCVYFSSVSVYGDRASNLAISEDTPVAPTTYYAAAKYASECILHQVAHTGGFPLLILRPCRVEGPGGRYANYGPVHFIRSILQENTVCIYGDGQERRDHLYIDDLVRIVAHLSRSECRGIYNLASGTSHSYLEILACLRNSLSQEFVIHHRPRTRPLIHQQFDVSRLLRAMPQCQFTPLAERLRVTYDYYASMPSAAV